MSQTKNKLSIPELISIGVFTALYFVLVTIATFTSNVIFPGFSNVFLPGMYQANNSPARKSIAT